MSSAVQKAAEEIVGASDAKTRRRLLSERLGGPVDPQAVGARERLQYNAEVVTAVRKLVEADKGESPWL